MRSRLTLALILFVALSVRAEEKCGDVLFVDMNNASKEFDACMEGVKQSGCGDIYRVGGRLMQNGQPEVVDSAYLDEVLKNYTGPGFKMFTISGEDGNSEFFGDSGTMKVSEITATIAKYRKQAPIKLSVHWGCYTANKAACDEQGLKNIAPTVVNSIGYTVQAPTKDKPANWGMIKEACKDRGDYMVEHPDYNALMRKMDPKKIWGLSICHDQAICSFEYGARDANGDLLPGNEDCEHTEEELNRRCSEFDPGEKGHQTFQDYLDASKPGFEDVPNDKASDGSKSPLRRYYSQLHLWRHCREQYKSSHDQNMDYPPKVIRLILFKGIVKSLIARHSDDIAEYNSMLAQYGLGQYALTGLESATRGEIVAKTRAATAKLRKFAYQNKDVNGIDPNVLFQMAHGYDQTLRELSSECSNQSWVHGDGVNKSPCIDSYEKVSQWQ